MQNSPTVVAAPPPLPLIPPPRPAGQITVLPFPPPEPFPGAPNSVFQITVLPFPPPPPFAGAPSTVDLSPIEFLLGLLAVVTIPALIYTFIFAFRCPPRRRRQPSAGDPSVASEISHHDAVEVAVPDAGVTYRKEAHAKEIGSECPVCLSVFADGEEVRQLSACKHSFHSSCIDMWLSNHANCPICRATILTTTTTKPSNSQRDNDSQQSHHEGDASNLV